MTFGPQVNPEDSQAMVSHFLAAGHVELDSAYVYNGGDTEKILGSILAQPTCATARVATKVNPRVTGKLDGASIDAQLTESLRRMGRRQADILYLHFPDPHTPVEETLAACAQLHAAGKFRELGLSNFAAWEVVDIWHVCRRHGWVVPTVYQGLYNGLSRNVEPELFPALRRLGMRFYAYNPLAGGILAGKYRGFEENPTPGRFTFRPNYRDRYWKKSFFDAVAILEEQCRTEAVTLVEAAFRWLVFHSQLAGSPDNGVIIGASRLAQLEANLASWSRGSLPRKIVEAFEAAWVEAKSDSPDYFRTSG